MFIETYYDERAALPGSTQSNNVPPYPELSGEELTVWRKYLPVTRTGRKYPLTVLWRACS